MPRASVYFGEDVRRPDAGLYSVHKRLQEEMCRQFHDGHGLRVVILRPASIIDAALHLSRTPGAPWNGEHQVWGAGSVCRSHLGKASCAALTADTDFACLHAITLPSPPLPGTAPADDPRRHCNVGTAASAIGFDFEMDVAALGYKGPSAEAERQPYDGYKRDPEGARL